MADKKKLRAPTGMAGLVRYEEDTESRIKLEPKIIVFIAIAIIFLEILLFSLF
ncbi:MAG: preprotein translocase subunit Sec61beta [Candidatus Aenigmarchaeota archaeon]|nr:preprotein translocase subunit Sec61beta [Candidatus Aenigmarchaeota archaeon]